MRRLDDRERTSAASELRGLLTAIAAIPEQLACLSSQLEKLRDDVEAVRIATALNACPEGGPHRGAALTGDARPYVDASLPGALAHAVRRRFAVSSGRGAEAVRTTRNPFTVLDAMRYSEQVHADALIFLDSAFASAAVVPAGHGQHVLCVIQAMAHVARRRMRGTPADPPAYELRALGLRCETVTRTRASGNGPKSAGPRAGEYLHDRIISREGLGIHFSSACVTDPRLVVSYVGIPPLA